MLVKRIKTPDSRDMEIPFYDFTRRAFSQLCLHPSWEVKRVVVTDNEKSMMYDIWEACFSIPLDRSEEFTAVIVGCYNMGVFTKAFEADSSRDATLRYMRDFGECIADNARPEFVTIFFLFVHDLSSSSRRNAVSFLTSGYMPLVCRIANAVMRPAYRDQWKACFKEMPKTSRLETYWQTLHNSYLAVECLVDVDSKQVFSEHGQDVARLLATFADFEREVIPPEALLETASRLALQMRSSAEYYSVVRAIHPRLLRIADAQALSVGETRPFGQLLLSVRQAIKMRRSLRSEFVNASHPMCAFETVRFSDRLLYF
jgi:hypothetical protein